MASGKGTSGNVPDLLSRAQTALKANDAETAEVLLTDLVQRDDRNAEALSLLGHALAGQGKFADAAARFEAALAIRPNDPKFLNALGSIYFSLHRPEDSEACFRAALKAAPKFANAEGNLGLVCQHLGKHDEALGRLRTAVHNGGATPLIALALGKELVNRFQPGKARSVLSQLVTSFPDFIDALVLLGVAEGDCGKPDVAEKLWRQAEKTDPEHPGPSVSRARFKQSSGDVDGAIREIERALSLDNQHAYALFSWAHIADNSEVAKLSRGEVLVMLEQAQAREGLSHEESVWLGFAAGKLLDREKNHVSAAENYVKANELVWRTSPVDKAMFRNWHDRLVSVFNQAFFEQNVHLLEREPEGLDRCGEGLVFIVGMPRSGTTLVEQILSRSECVTTGGERPEIEALMHAFLNLAGDGKGGPVDSPLNLADVRKLAAGHHEAIRSVAGESDCFTDKSPRNFMNLGVIACLFPRARIIHCKRNPVDTCLSCYFNHFGFNSVSYSYSQEVLGFFYTLYENLMIHWRQVMPGNILDAVYEEIVRQPDGAIRRLTDFCGFEWNEGFLHPEDSKRAVNTASLAQVRKPIYSDSVGRWKPYEPYIGPLLAAMPPDAVGRS